MSIVGQLALALEKHRLSLAEDIEEIAGTEPITGDSLARQKWASSPIRSRNPVYMKSCAFESKQDRRTLSEPEPINSREPIPVIPRAVPERQQPRVVGSPLPTGGPAGVNVRRALASGEPANNGSNHHPSALPLGRALPGAVAQQESSGLQRAMNLLRMAMPIVQRILPLLDGNVGTAVANMIAPRPQHPAPPKVDLKPIEEGISTLQTQHRLLREQVVEQNTALRRVEDRLEMVREATDRNTLEQQELLEDLKSFSKKVKIFAWVAAAFVAVAFALGFALEIAMFLHLRSVLP
jgi:hypothetical protein